MRFLTCAVVGLLMASPARAQTADEAGELIKRLVELDSIELAKDVKFRPGLEPSLHALDADESAMKVLSDPHQVFGQNAPGAAGWYRISFTVPEKLGKIAIPKNGYNLGIESNVLGRWEAYTYINGKPAGLWSKDGMLTAFDQRSTVWVSNAPMPAKAGDKITVAILAMSSPLGRGSPDGFALRHLRLRFALAHTASRSPFYGGVPAPGQGNGLHGARELLSIRKGEDLTALQAKLKGPLSRMNLVFEAAETGKLDELSKAMKAASVEINDALKK